jgi:hypothetical protein
MTKREAAIVMAFTGKMLGDFSTFHGYVEEIMERPVFTHEMGSKEIAEEISDKAREDFVNIEVI